MIMMVQTGTLRLKMFTDSRTMGALKFYCHDLNMMIGRVDKFEITERETYNCESQFMLNLEVPDFQSMQRAVIRLMLRTI